MTERRDGDGRMGGGRPMDPERPPRFEPDRSADDRFDDALGRVARSFIAERLPQGILDPAVGASLGLPATDDQERDGNGRIGDEPGRRRIPGFAVAGAAVVVLLLGAATLAPTLLRPGGSPPTPGPTTSAGPSLPVAFRTTAEITAALAGLGYTCADGTGDVPVEPAGDAAARRSAVCTAPEQAESLSATVTLGESAAGQVVEVQLNADIVGFDIPAVRRAVAATFAEAVAVVVPQGLGNAVATWVANNVPVVERKGILTVELRGYALHLDRDVEGGYTLMVVAAGT